MNIAPAYNIAPDEKTLFSIANEKFEQLKFEVSSQQTLSLSHDEVERLINDKGREVLRELFQSHLTLRGLSEPVEPVKGADQVERTHYRRGTKRTLMSILGEVNVLRARLEGRGISSLSPIDGDLNLPLDSFSFEVRRIAAMNAARMSFDATVGQIEDSTGAKVAKKQVEELVQRASRDFIAFYDQTAIDVSAHETSNVLVLTFDGKGIVMRNEALREQTQKAAKNNKPKLRSRLTKGEKRNRKRMACVAAVYTVAPYHRTPEEVIQALWREDENGTPTRPKPEFKRVWASVERPVSDVIEEAFEEAQSRDPKRVKHWVVVVDGDPRQMRRIKHVAKSKGVKVTFMLDLIHALEYLWKAAYVFNPEGSIEAEQWVRERLARILRGEAGQVAGGIRRSATKRKLDRRSRKAADDCARYFKNHKEYMKYDVALEFGFPLCSGVIEGACRHLIRDRLELTGCRWGLKGAEAILCIRAIICSGDFNEYWEFHKEQELKRNHLERYADGKLPTLARPRPGKKLRVVK